MGQIEQIIPGGNLIDVLAQAVEVRKRNNGSIIDNETIKMYPTLFWGKEGNYIMTVWGVLVSHFTGFAARVVYSGNEVNIVNPHRR